MNALQWMRAHLVPRYPPSMADVKYEKAMALTHEVTEAVRSRKFPDPFSPIIRDLRLQRAVSEHDQMQAADIYGRLPDETKIIRK